MVHKRQRQESILDFVLRCVSGSLVLLGVLTAACSSSNGGEGPEASDELRVPGVPFELQPAPEEYEVAVPFLTSILDGQSCDQLTESATQALGALELGTTKGIAAVYDLELVAAIRPDDATGPFLLSAVPASVVFALHRLELPATSCDPETFASRVADSLGEARVVEMETEGWLAGLPSGPSPGERLKSYLRGLMRSWSDARLR
jgi:hypothetical protein